MDGYDPVFRTGVLTVSLARPQEYSCV
jgi:hypothetical protein